MVKWDDVKLLEEVHNRLSDFIVGGSELGAEGNYYYDVSKCGIGFHGDG